MCSDEVKHVYIHKIDSIRRELTYLSFKRQKLANLDETFGGIGFSSF